MYVGVLVGVCVYVYVPMYICMCVDPLTEHQQRKEKNTERSQILASLSDFPVTKFVSMVWRHFDLHFYRRPEEGTY